ncbi:MAG TPA: aminopeptidase P family protein [Gemmatimonadaceae bacterium]|nr:aminopeptidase P family protein [Gemmatimonadaceae bacterium]
MTDARERRIAALREDIAGDLDALLITSLPNVRYLTGFSGSSALLLVTQRELFFITDFRYATQVADEVGDLAKVRIEPVSLWNGLWATLGEVAKVTTVGFESAHIFHRDFQRLLESGGGRNRQWRPSVNAVERLRESKDAGEVKLIRRAAAIAVEALQATLPRLAPGMTELQVAGVLEKALRDAGSEGFPFPSIVASGPRAALPHARSSSRVVEAGDFLLLDFGAEYRGYCSDITRTLVVGSANGEQSAVYDIVRQANALAAGSVRAGMTGQDADALARGYIEREGYGEAFGHGLGHGLGLEVHEAPRLARTAEGTLSVGAVVTIEPGIYRPGWGGIRIEDDVHLGAGGPEILTDFTRELIEVA